MVSLRLKRAVIKQLGNEEDLFDIAEYGADGGYNGFIWHEETNRFYDNNAGAIDALVQEEADEFGMSPGEMVAGFRVLNGDFDPYEIDLFLEGDGDDTELDDDDITVLKNALAWFALECVARDYVNENEE